MGYQESWLYVQPQMCFSNLIRAYEKTARTDYYRTMGAEPMSVVILKRPFGEVPKGAKLLWVCGDRCFHAPVGVFNGNLKSPAKLCFIPVEQVLDPDDYRLKGIDLNSRAPSENAYMKRYSVEDYIVRTRAERERQEVYLLSHGIDMAVLDYCFQHRLLYEAADYHNAVFVGYDGRTPRYATLRGTLSGSSFKRDVTGSNKQFCFSITGTDSAKLNVFECAIDALSYLTQVKMQGGDWRQESVLSLGGVYKSSPNEVPKVPAALQGYLNAHADVREIVLRLDNDAVGRGAASDISRAVADLPVSVELPAEGKDYNEWLMRQKGISPRPRARNEPER